MQIEHNPERLKVYDKVEVLRVLKTLPVDVIVLFAGRCALRVLPLLFKTTNKQGQLAQQHLFVLCRAVLLSWAANIKFVDDDSPTYFYAGNSNAKAAAAKAALAVTSAATASNVKDAYESANYAAACAYKAANSFQSINMQLVPDCMMQDIALCEKKVDLLTQPLFYKPLNDAYAALWQEAEQRFNLIARGITPLIQSIMAGTPDLVGIRAWILHQAETIKEGNGVSEKTGAIEEKPSTKTEESTTADDATSSTNSTPPPLTASALLSQHSTESVAKIDALGRDKLTQALASLLLSREDAQAFAIGLFGHWGSGKSSQIEFLTKQLKKEALHKADLKQAGPNIKVATFNAWYNEKASNVGAMLAQTVVDTLVEDVGFRGRLWLAVQLSVLKTNKLRRALEQDAQTFSYKITDFVWLTPYVFGLVVIAVGGYYLPIEKYTNNFWDASLKVAAIAAGLYAMASQFTRAHLTDWFKKIDVDKTLSLFQLPDYSPHKGLSIEIYNTLRDICWLHLNAPPDPTKGDYLLLVVDDLDRCSVDTVKEVLDAVRLVAHIPRVVSLVAIDERMAFAAVEKHYQQFGHAGRTPALVARDYLAKVFQVSMTLPKCGANELSSLIGATMFKDVQSAVAAAVQPPVDNSATSNSPVKLDELIPENIKDSTENKPYDLHEKPNKTRSTVHANNQPTPIVQAPVLPTQTALVEEKALFEILAESFEFGNPRLLWRVYMAWKLLKSLHFTEVYTAEQIDTPMRMLFWQEWLHTQEAKDKTQFEVWIQNGGDQVQPTKMPFGVFDAVNLQLRNKWADLAQLRALVEIVLLPSSIS